MNVRYAHTNLVAKDWRRLAAFYQSVFDCVPVPPERDLAGDWLDRATGIAGAHIQGAHLRLPGYGEAGPTLEIFQYQPVSQRPQPRPNALGLAHLAFEVQDIAATARSVVERGGSLVGELAVRPIPGVGTVSFQYLTDPEGNILELQSWRREGSPS